MAMQCVVIANVDDATAHSYAAYSNAHGMHAIVVEPEEAGRSLTLVCREGEATLSHEGPILFRAAGPHSVREDFDSAFLAAENAATLWSLASLAPGKVINRPTSYGRAGRMSQADIITESRASLPPRATVYSDAPTEPTGDGPWWLRPSYQRKGWVWPAPAALPGPFVSRQGVDKPAYVEVVVVGQRAWSDERVEALHARSVSAIEKLDLVFASVLWAVCESGERHWVVRIDPFPQVDHLAASSSVFAALLEEFES